MSEKITRRTALLTGSAIAAAGVFTPNILHAAEPINVGSLTPNTGGGGPFGPKITASHKRVVELVNSQGGVLGRQINLFQENSETNPETSVRAADKLINVNKVVGLLGTWSSSVTLGIMPKCQKPVLFKCAHHRHRAFLSGIKRVLCSTSKPCHPYGVAPLVVWLCGVGLKPSP